MMLADKYQITDIIESSSSGKFGKLYRGEVKESGKPVLIKALDKSRSDNTSIERLRNEAEFSFEDDSLPHILDYYESDQEAILVRNFVEGKSLKQIWTSLKRKNQLDFLKSLLEELSVVFSELEKDSVVHGDIRQGNIIISSLDPLKVHLIDFALAIRTNLPEQRKIIFPLGYAAPELLLNCLSIADQRTDIYSLGITIWNLFTDELPLAHPNPSIFTNLQLTHPLPDHSSLPKNLFPILSKMSAKFSFKLPPNKLSEAELYDSLIKGMDSRYHNLQEVLIDWEKSKPNWRFYQRMSFR